MLSRPWRVGKKCSLNGSSASEEKPYELQEEVGEPHERARSLLQLWRWRFCTPSLFFFALPQLWLCCFFAPSQLWLWRSFSLLLPSSSSIMAMAKLLLSYGYGDASLSFSLLSYGYGGASRSPSLLGYRYGDALQEPASPGLRKELWLRRSVLHRRECGLLCQKFAPAFMAAHVLFPPSRHRHSSKLPSPTCTFLLHKKSRSKTAQISPPNLCSVIRDSSPRDASLQPT